MSDGLLDADAARDLAAELGRQHTLEYLDAMTRCADQLAFVEAYLDEQSREMDNLVRRAEGR